MPDTTISIIGNLAIDRIYRDRERVDMCPGGTAFYGGMTLAKLNARVALISKIGFDYPDRFLKILEGTAIDLRSVTRSNSSPSTAFLWYYSDNQWDREGRVSSRGPSIKLEDIPHRIKNSACVLIGIVAGEMDSRVLSDLDFDSIGMVAADLHSIRQISNDGLIGLGRGTMFRSFLHHIHVLKGSFDEVKAFSTASSISETLYEISSLGPEIVLATNGAYGSVLCSGGTIYNVPAFRVKEIDATGAGDIFLSSFLYFYGLMGEEPVESAHLASAAASFGVEGTGVRGLADEWKIRKRAVSLMRGAG